MPDVAAAPGSAGEAAELPAQEGAEAMEEEPSPSEAAVCQQIYETKHKATNTPNIYDDLRRRSPRRQGRRLLRLRSGRVSRGK